MTGGGCWVLGDWVRSAFFEFVEGAVEGAFGAGFVAAEVVEIVGADDEDVSEIAVGDVAAFADVGAVIVETVVPDAGFGAVEVRTFSPVAAELRVLPGGGPSRGSA